MIARIGCAARAALAAALLGYACAPKVAPAPPAGAPRYPEFVTPAAPAELAPPQIVARHDLAWRVLQTGDLRAAERQFSAVLKETPAFYPSSVGLGYVALARKEFDNAVPHFDRALAVDAQYVPALVGRGEALLAAGNHEAALASFEKAVVADPSLTALRQRVEVLRFRGLQDDIAAARQAAEAGRLDEARGLYGRAVAASPESPFLHRELAALERRAGNPAQALVHAQTAASLEPSDARNFILIGEIYEAQAQYSSAAEAYASAAALEPSDQLAQKIEALHEKAAFATMPGEYQAIEGSPAITRAQLAALLGVHLDALLSRSPRRLAVVLTDTRGHWAAPWIQAVTSAGIMPGYPNHTFQPDATVRRADLAAAASQVLSLLAFEQPRLAASWRNPERRFPDVPPGHLDFPAAALAVEAGVMTTVEDGTFQLSRAVTGADALAAVRKLKDLAESQPR